MEKTKAITQIPMGKIKEFIENNFEEIMFSKKAEEFFENEFLGDLHNVGNLLDIKDGNPSEVSNWLKEEYNIDLDLNGDYAIASVLAILLEFVKRAEFRVIKGDEQEYGGGYHEFCKTFKFISRNKNIPFYELNVKDKDFQVIVSEEELDLAVLNNPLLFKKKVYKDNREKTHLTLPMVSYQEECDLGEVFKGSSMIKKDSSDKYEITDAKTITKLDLGLDKVEVKQVAAVMMIVGCATPLDLTPRHTIKDDFYIYIRYNNRVLFGSKMIKEDFVQGNELEFLKEQEKPSGSQLDSDELFIH